VSFLEQEKWIVLDVLRVNRGLRSEPMMNWDYGEEVFAQQLLTQKIFPGTGKASKARSTVPSRTRSRSSAVNSSTTLT